MKKALYPQGRELIEQKLEKAKNCLQWSKELQQEWSDEIEKLEKQLKRYAKNGSIV